MGLVGCLLLSKFSKSPTLIFGQRWHFFKVGKPKTSPLEQKFTILIKSITPKSIVRTCWRTWSMVLLRRARQQRRQDPEMFHHTAAAKTSTPPSIELQGHRPSKFPGARRRRRSPRGRRRVIPILGGAEAPAKKILQVPRRPKCSGSWSSRRSRCSSAALTRSIPRRTATLAGNSDHHHGNCDIDACSSIGASEAGSITTNPSFQRGGAMFSYCHHHDNCDDGHQVEACSLRSAARSQTQILRTGAIPTQAVEHLRFPLITSLQNLLHLQGDSLHYHHNNCDGHQYNLPGSDTMAMP